MFEARIIKQRKALIYIVVLLAIMIRLVWLVESRDDPSSQQPLVDARTYHELAVGLAENGTLDEHFLWQAPLYPLFLAGLYRLFGVSLLLVKLLQIALAGGTCFLSMRLGYKYFDDKTGLLAGIMVALCGPLLFFDQQLLATGLAVFWMVALANLFLQVRRQTRPEIPWFALLLGVVGALAILTRPVFFPLVFGLLLWPARGRFYVTRLGLGLVGLLIVLVPYTMTMQKNTGHCGLLPPSGAINLHIGNNPDYDKTISIRTGLAWENLIQEPMRHGYEPGPWNGQEYFRLQVKQFVNEQPREFLWLLVKKTSHLFSSRELPRNLDMYVHRQWSNVLSFLVFKVGPWGFPLGLLLPLAAIGLMVSDFRKLGPLLLILFGYAGSLVLVFVASRYRAPMLPLLCVLGARGLIWFWSQVRQRNWRPLVPASILGLGLMLLGTLPGPFAQENSNMEAELHYGVGWNHYHQENWVEAERELRLAVLLDEGYPEAQNFLALVLAHAEQWDEAMEHFQAAVHHDPGYSEAVNNLEVCRSKRAEADYRRGRAMEASNLTGAMELYFGILDFHSAWPDASVRLAWIMSTSENADLRNGAGALDLLSGSSIQPYLKDSYVMYVKSLALAELGRFDEALELAIKAKKKTSIKSRGVFVDQLDQAIHSYRAGVTPY